MSPLPVGDPQAGYLWPDKTDATPAGDLPAEEQAWRDAQTTAYEADVEAVTTAEAEVEQQRLDDALAAIETPKLSSIVPNWAQVGGQPVYMDAFGNGFEPDGTLLWNGADERTDFFDSTHVGTWINAPIYAGPDHFTVGYKLADGTPIEGELVFEMKL